MFFPSAWGNRTSIRRSTFARPRRRRSISGATRYTAARGVPELREAICEVSAQRRKGVTYTPAECVVSVGAKHTLFNLALALYDPGDEVIIPAPYWVSYPEQVRLAGATPVIVQIERGRRLPHDARRLARRHHLEDQGAHPLLAVEPDRRRVHAVSSSAS